MFQHTAARRRLLKGGNITLFSPSVSTHSRAEAAACKPKFFYDFYLVSTHSRAEAAASS